MRRLKPNAVQSLGINAALCVAMICASACAGRRTPDPAYVLQSYSESAIKNTYLGSHDADVVSVSAAAAAPVAVTVDDQNELVLWDMQDNREVLRRTLPGGRVGLTAISADGSIFAWSEDGRVHFQTIARGDGAWGSFPAPPAHSSRVAGLRFLDAEEDRAAIVYEDGLVRIWSVTHGKIEAGSRVDRQPYPTPLAISPEGFAVIKPLDGLEVHNFCDTSAIAAISGLGAIIVGISDDSEVVVTADRGKSIVWGIGRRESSTLRFWRWRDPSAEVASVLLPLPVQVGTIDAVLAIAPLGGSLVAIVSTHGIRFIDAASGEALASHRVSFSYSLVPARIAPLSNRMGVLICVGAAVHRWDVAIKETDVNDRSGSSGTR